MGKHTSGGAALAQHGMSERASQRRQPSPPPPRSLPRTRKTRTGLPAAPAPRSPPPAARRDGAWRSGGEEGGAAPAPPRVPLVCAAEGGGRRGASRGKATKRRTQAGSGGKSRRAARGCGEVGGCRGRPRRWRDGGAGGGRCGGREAMGQPRTPCPVSGCAGAEGSVKLSGTAGCPLPSSPRPPSPACRARKPPRCIPRAGKRLLCHRKIRLCLVLFSFFSPPPLPSPKIYIVCADGYKIEPKILQRWHLCSCPHCPAVSKF